MKILLFSSRQLCYYSNGYFVDKMAEAMERRGYEVTICDLFSIPGEKEKELASMQNEQVQELLEAQIGRTYDAVIDFNSFLPRLENEDGIPYPQLIDAPFFNYIVDHPLYHHPALVHQMDNYNVICLDEDHKRYIEENYPHIRSVLVLPIGAEKAIVHNFKEGKKGTGMAYTLEQQAMTFLGTHIPSIEIMDQIDALPKKIRGQLHGLIDLLMADPELPVDQGFLQLYPEYRELQLSESEIDFATCMNQRYLADKYLRCRERELVVKALLQGGIPLQVYGNGWGDFVDELPAEQAAIFTEMGTVDLDTSIQMIRDASVLLNVQPRFTHGIHDRITAAMLNQTPCFSDGTNYLKKKIRDGEEIVYYDKRRLEEAPEKARRLLNDEELRSYIAGNAYKKALQQYSWDAWVEQFEQFILLEKRKNGKN